MTAYENRILGTAWSTQPNPYAHGKSEVVLSYNAMNYLTYYGYISNVVEISKASDYGDSRRDWIP